MGKQETISITGARGGSGATTTCIALALLTTGVTQLVGNPDDIEDIAGNRTALTQNIAISHQYRPVEGLAIIDGGSIPNPLPHDTAPNHQAYLLVRGPSYAALHTAQRTDIEFHGIILLTEDARALQRADVTAALNLPVVAEIDHDKDVHRVADAGITSLGRMPKSLVPIGKLVRN